tara:strand:- start:1347 stop:1622 length:276 start_codon:yes stop_codon:yes gene_type:complete
MSKILRIDRQGCCEPRVYNSKEDLRLQLIDFHSIDYNDICDENDENYKPIENFTLQEILDYGEWDYETITDEQAKEYDDVKVTIINATGRA